MARRKRTTQDTQSIGGVGMTAKHMKRRKPLNSDLLLDIEPLTENQKNLFTSYDEGKNIVAYGAAGTGKTFIVLYNALKDVLNERTPYEKIYIIRSLVQTREIGFLPGGHEDKAELFEIPYKKYGKVFVPTTIMKMILRCSMVILNAGNYFILEHFFFKRVNI
jgi:predicted ribonuclease YlaK